MILHGQKEMAIFFLILHMQLKENIVICFHCQSNQCDFKR